MELSRTSSIDDGILAPHGARQRALAAQLIAACAAALDYKAKCLQTKLVDEADL